MEQNGTERNKWNKLLLIISALSPLCGTKWNKVEQEYLHNACFRLIDVKKKQAGSHRRRSAFAE